MADNKLFGAILLASAECGHNLAKKLQSRGIDTILVETSDELYRVFKKERRVNFLIIQQSLNGFLSGLEIVERLQSTIPSPVSILVGTIGPAECKEAERLGVRSIIEEETRIDELVAAVLTHFGRLTETHSAIPQVSRRPTTNVLYPRSRLLTKLRGHLQDVTLSIPEIVNDLSDDPYTAEELLKIANSICANSSRKVASVHEAVVRLGIRHTIATVLIAEQSQYQSLAEATAMTSTTTGNEFSQRDGFDAIAIETHSVEDNGYSDSARKHRVLVIDDDAAIVKTANRMLSMEGFDVVGCSNPDEALALSEQVDVVLCDVHLGTMTGMELIKRLRKTGVEAPVIMISGDRTRETVVDCIDAGIVDYIIKPFSRALLVEKVTTHLLNTPFLRSHGPLTEFSKNA